MPFEKEIEIEVVKQEGHCSANHRVGEKFLIKNYKTPQGICLSAFHAIWPVARTFLLNGVQPWDENKDETYVACPDPDNPVVFKIRRIRK